MPKLSKRIVDAAVAKDKEYFIWDDTMPNFGLRVFPSGKRSYVFQYRAHGRTRRYAIGLHGAWTVEQARKKAGRFATKSIKVETLRQSAKHLLETSPSPTYAMPT